MEGSLPDYKQWKNHAVSFLLNKWTTELWVFWNLEQKQQE